jgi:hypothetical protein
MNTAPAVPPHETHHIPIEESEIPLEVARVDDEEGSFVSLSKGPEGFGLADDFFVSFSLDNAARLAELLRVLSDTSIDAEAPTCSK